MPHPLVTQLRFARSELARCLEGVSEEDARQEVNLAESPPRDPPDPCGSPLRPSRGSSTIPAFRLPKAHPGGLSHAPHPASLPEVP